MPARGWRGAVVRAALVLSLIVALPAVAAEKKKAAPRAAKPKPLAALIPDNPRDRAITACKEHVDRVMKSPIGTKHGTELRVNEKGGEAFLVAGTVEGLREGAQIQAEWECEVDRVGSGLMHTKTKLFLPR
jgi:hypothetical protein